jgi:hypothetical protein
MIETLGGRAVNVLPFYQMDYLEMDHTYGTVNGVVMNYVIHVNKLQVIELNAMKQNMLVILEE